MELSTIVTSDMMIGVLDEVVACLPAVMPAAIAMLGIRKGIGFIFGILRKA